MMRAVLILLLACVAAGGETLRLTPGDDWFRVLNGGGLNPGDEVVLGAGVYSDARRLEMRHRGTAEAPIVVRAEDGAKVVFRRPDARQNSINLKGCQFLVLRGLEITGGSAGIRIFRDGEVMSGDLLFEDLHLHHVGGVAITANEVGSTYGRMVFRGNHIHHTAGHGEAFYLGSNNSEGGETTGYVHECVIEGNYIHDLNGPGVSQGDGIELKDGSWGNVVRDNVIHDTKFPGIIAYGTDGKAANVIERNVVWNTGDHGMQIAADAVVRNNIVFDVGGDGIHCRQHQSAVVENLTLIHNTVVVGKGRSGSAVRLNAARGNVVVANNALSGRGGLRITAGGEVTAVGNVSEGWVPEGASRFFPLAGGSLVGTADERYLVEFDFDGWPRSGRPTVGAYGFVEGGKPKWVIRKGAKPRAEADHSG